MIIGATSVFKRTPPRARDHVVGFNHSAASPYGLVVPRDEPRAEEAKQEPAGESQGEPPMPRRTNRGGGDQLQRAARFRSETTFLRGCRHSWHLKNVVSLRKRAA